MTFRRERGGVPLVICRGNRESCGSLLVTNLIPPHGGAPAAIPQFATTHPAARPVDGRGEPWNMKRGPLAPGFLGLCLPEADTRQDQPRYWECRAVASP